MPQTADTNRRVVLAERPNGLPDAKTLQLQHKPVPQPGNWPDALAHALPIA